MVEVPIPLVIRVIYGMQNIPGAGNGLTYQGKPLTDWWTFLGEFDNAMNRQMTLMGT